MTRLGGITTAACLSGLVLLSGCGAPPSDGTASTSVLSGVSVLETWRDAIAPLEAASATTWTVDLTETRRTMSVHNVLEYEVDGRSGDAQLRATSEVRDGAGQVIDANRSAMEGRYTSGVIYIRSTAWTGDRAGTWLRVTDDGPMPDLGFPWDIEAPQTVPAGLRVFQPREVVQTQDGMLVRGRIPALQAMSLLHRHKLLADPAIRQSLSGFASATASLSEDGTFKALEITGRGHTIRGDDEMSWVLSGLEDVEATVTLTSTGRPVAIAPPPPGLVRDDWSVPAPKAG